MLLASRDAWVFKQFFNQTVANWIAVGKLQNMDCPGATAALINNRFELAPAAMKEIRAAGLRLQVAPLRCVAP